jgi:hypothetical protein
VKERIILAKARRCAAGVVAVLVGCGGSHGAAPRDAHVEMAIAEQQDPRAVVCTAADAAGETAAPPFDVIQMIFDDNCTSCHSHGADVDLSPGLAWRNLVGAPAPVTESCGGTLVVAGDPDASYLVQKISSDHPCSGMRMPRTEFAPDPLPDCVIGLVRNWITAGAPSPAGGDGGSD